MRLEFATIATVASTIGIGALMAWIRSRVVRAMSIISISRSKGVTHGRAELGQLEIRTKTYAPGADSDDLLPLRL